MSLVAPVSLMLSPFLLLLVLTPLVGIPKVGIFIAGSAVKAATPLVLAFLTPEPVPATSRTSPIVN